MSRFQIFSKAKCWNILHCRNFMDTDFRISQYITIIPAYIYIIRYWCVTRSKLKRPTLSSKLCYNTNIITCQSVPRYVKLPAWCYSPDFIKSRNQRTLRPVFSSMFGHQKELQKVCNIELWLPVLGGSQYLLFRFHMRNCTNNKMNLSSVKQWRITR